MQKKRKSLFSVVLIVVLLLTTLSACSSSPERLIVGEWEIENTLLIIRNDGTLQVREGDWIERGKWEVRRNNELDIYFWSPGWLSYELAYTLYWSDDSSTDEEEWHITRQNLYMSGGVLTRR